MPNDSVSGLATSIRAGFPVFRIPDISPRVRSAVSLMQSPVLLAGDLVAIASAMFIGGCIHGGVHGPLNLAMPAGFREMLHQADPTLGGAGLAVEIIVLFSYLIARGHYARGIWFEDGAHDVLVAVSLAFACSLLLLIPAGAGLHSAGYLVMWLSAVPLLFCARKMLCTAFVALCAGEVRMVLFGDPDQTAHAAATIGASARRGLRVVGSFQRHQVANPRLISNWQGLLDSKGGNCIALVGSPEDDLSVVRAIADLEHSGIPLAVLPDTCVLPMNQGKPHYFADHGVLMLTGAKATRLSAWRAAKRFMDLTVACLMVLLASPVLLFIALLVRRDGGPALFQHQRIGAGGKMFYCTKFRSMSVNSAAILQDLLARDPAAAAEWAATQKLRNDPRVTGIGRLLRKTSLDELPQLLNIVRGEMSLVGPRPIVPGEVRFYGDHISDYHRAKPGITGLWQVSGRSDTTYTRRVELDVWYVRNWSFWQDIKILLLTVPAVLFGKGAV